MRAGTAAIVLIGILVGLPSLAYPYGRDQGIYGVVAQTVLDGGLPYRDVFDFKPPGIFYIYAAIQTFMGTGEWTFRVVDLFWQIATALLLARLGTILIGARGGLLSGLIYLICYYSLGFWHGAQPDGFLTLLLVIFILRLTAYDQRGRAEGGDGTGSKANDAAQHGISVFSGCVGLLIGGVCLGLAALLKYTALTMLPLAMIGLRESSGPSGAKVRLARFGWTLAGCCVPLLGWVAYAYSAGMWDAFWSLEFGFAPQYARFSHPGLTGSFNEFTRALFRGFDLGLWWHLTWIIALAGPALDRETRRRCIPILPPLVLSLAGVAVQGKYFPYHMLVALPWLALLAGLSLDRVLGVFGRTRAGVHRRGFVLSACIVVAVSAVLSQKKWVAYVQSRFATDKEAWLSSFHTNDFSAYGNDRLAHYIRGATLDDEAFYLWGFEPQVYLLADRRCPTRFIYNLPQRAPYAPDEWKRDLLNELTADPPALIAVERGDHLPHVLGNTLDSAEALESFAELRSWMMAGYEPDRTVRRFQVFRRRDFPTSGGSEAGTGP